MTHGITTNKVHFGVTVPATNQTTCSKVCHGIRRCFQSLARSTDIRSQTGCEEHLSSALLLVTVDSAKNLPVSLRNCAIISYACTTYIIIVPEHNVLSTKCALYVCRAYRCFQGLITVMKFYTDDLINKGC